MATLKGTLFVLLHIPERQQHPTNSTSWEPYENPESLEDSTVRRIDLGGDGLVHWVAIHPEFQGAFKFLRGLYKVYLEAP